MRQLNVAQPLPLERLAVSNQLSLSNGAEKMSRFSQLILILLAAFPVCAEGVFGDCDITGLLQQAAVRPHSEHSSNDSEFVMIHIPKTGGTSEIKTSLWWSGGIQWALRHKVERSWNATPHTTHQLDVVNLRLPMRRMWPARGLAIELHKGRQLFVLPHWSKRSEWV